MTRPYGLILLLGFLLSTTAQTTQSPISLEPGKPIESEVTSAQPQVYQVNLVAGQFMRVTVKLEAGLVGISLTAPDGKQVATVNPTSLTGSTKQQSLSYEAATSGTYQISIRALLLPSSTARKVYEVGLEVKTAAAATDKRRIAAEQLLAEALKLARQKETAQSAIEKAQQTLPIWRELGDRYREAYTLNFLATTYRVLAREDKALEYYEQRVKLFRELKDRRSEGSALVSLGMMYNSLRRFEKAMEYLEIALTISREIKDRAAEGSTLTALGTAQSSQGRYDKAIAYYEQALSINREINLKVAETSTLNQLGDAYRGLNRYEKAIEYYEQVLKLYQEAKSRRGEGNVLYSLGKAHSLLGRHEKAIEYYEQELTIFREVKDRRGEGNSLYNLADEYRVMERQEKAIVYYEQALAIYRELKFQGGEINALMNLGKAHRLLGQHEKALAYHEQLLTIYRTLKDRSGEDTEENSFLPESKSIFRTLKDRQREGTALYDLGTIYRSLSQYEKAIKHYKQALSISRDSREGRTEGYILYNLGLAFKQQGREGKADDYFKQALAIFQGLGDAASVHKRYEIAIEYYEQVLLIFREIKDRKSEGDTLNNLGLAYNSLGRYEKAIVQLEQALTIRRAVKDQRGAGNALNNLGIAYSALGRIEKAIASYEQALVIFREIKYRPGEANTLNNLGSTLSAQSYFEKAIEYLEKALTINRQVKYRRSEEGNTLNNLGNAYRMLGRYEKAIEYFEQSLIISREVKDRIGEGNALNNLGIASNAFGRYEKAIEYLEQTLTIYRREQNRAGEASTLNNIGNAHLALGHFEKAIEYYEQSLVINRAIKFRRGEGNALNNLAIAYRVLGRYEKVAEYYVQVLAIVREVKDREGEGSALNNLMVYWKAVNQPRLAIFYGKQAVNSYQTIRSEVSKLETASQQSFLKAKEKTYRDLADLLIGLGRLPEAQQVLDLLKEEEYFDYVRRDNNEAAGLKGRASLTPIEARLEKEYAEIADFITALGKELEELNQMQQPDAAQLTRRTDLDQKLQLATQRFQSFLGRLEKELGNTAEAGKQIASVKSAEGFQDTLRELGAGTVALYTIVGENKYSVILITPQAQVAGEYPISRADLHKKIFALKDALKSPSSNLATLQTQAAELYKILIGPIAKNLDGAKAETLMWSLDGALRYLPMGVLFDAERKQYLLERYRTVVYTPAGASDLKNQPRANWQGAGFGVSKAISNAEVGSFKALSGVPGELKSVIRTADNQNGVIEGAMYLDEQFTEESFRDALRKRTYPLIHVASHFAFKPGDSLKSFLLLGNGKALTLEEIRNSQNLFGGVDLLALSACETGVGEKDEEGREVEGFGVLAQNKGAKAVLATLWPVADESTAKLMAEFYRLREAKSANKAEALRQAQLQLLRGAEKKNSSEERGVKLPNQAPNVADPMKPHAHPYYWAPFILIGNWK